ncbi:hypothetical protein ACJ41O_014402 [Fusarium nematophilum]
MAMIGPSQAETAFLSMRRPFISLLLAIGTPAPNPSSGSIYADPIAALESTDLLDHLDILDHKGVALGVIIAIFEYAVVIGAAANCVYQIYRLTFNAVALAPIVVLLPETAILFSWVVPLVPIHLLSFVAFALAFRATSKPSKTSRARRLLDELTPCYLQRPLHLSRRRGCLWRPLASLLNNFGVCGHIMLGTVLLGSVLFITVADVLPIVESLVLGAIASRDVLLFELQGLRKVRLDADEGGLTTLEANTNGRNGGDSKEQASTGLLAAGDR